MCFVLLALCQWCVSVQGGDRSHPLHSAVPNTAVQHPEAQHQSVCPSQLSVVLLHLEGLAGLHEDALHHLPVVILAGGSHAVHLLLPMDGPPVLLPGHREEDVGGGVLEAHLVIPNPVSPAAHHRPVVQVIALASLPERTHLLE